uniref:Past-1 n=1 Tax=Riptortus pedestris TaxID=329032 RepID=R4WT07_RIPPE|nr:past-1 [Riptortus pedestris]
MISRKFCCRTMAMFSRFQKISKVSSFRDVQEKLKTLYETKLLPLEEKYSFHAFHSPPIGPQYFFTNPMVMLIGQYSTGKTTLLHYIIGKDFPGMRIGPEPTTDKFIILMKNNRDVVIPGNVLISDPTKHFQALSKFGLNFLNKLQCSLLDSPVLDSITFIDTPGILSGEKQRVQRGYDFEKVLEWFSENADRIILLFDSHKLDISDEFRRSIESLKGNEDKIRIVLNKADLLDQHSLIRVYGALMWSLGKILQTPEVVRVFIGSFWSNAMFNDTNRRLFEQEENELFQELQSLPKNSIMRKINDLNKRAKLALVHAYIMGTLYEKMPTFFGKEDTKNKLISELNEVYSTIQTKFELHPGDFPDIEKFKENLKIMDFRKLQKLNMGLIEKVEEMQTSDMAELLKLFPEEELTEATGGIFMDDASPYRTSGEDGVYEGSTEPGWIVETQIPDYSTIFHSLQPFDGKLRSAAKKELEKTRLPRSTLAKIWKLADIDNDGYLNEKEFGLALYLAKLKTNGNDIPDVLPQHLIPPNMRK